MTVLALLIIEFSRLCGIFLYGRVKDARIMKTVAIRAGGRILIAFQDCLAMAGGHIFFITMAFRTFFYYRFLKTLPIRLCPDGMDVLVTVVALEIQFDIMEFCLYSRAMSS
jgi:hypothetical protein